jgi:hypothetical protein
VPSIIRNLSARVMELNFASAAEVGCCASSEQFGHGRFGRWIERAERIPVQTGMSTFGFGQHNRILHIRHQFDKLVIRVSTCCCEKPAISPAVTDWPDKWSL